MTDAGHSHRDWDDPAAWTREILLDPALAPATEALLDAVQLAPRQRLLDLACGLGHTTAAATTRGLDAVGIDLSEARVAAARDRWPDAKFSVADASAPPDGPWDAVVCRLGAHHLSPGWADAAQAVLAPGGRIAIAEWPPRHERDRENGMRPVRHWVTALEQAGFQDVRVKTAIAPFATLAQQDPQVAESLSEHDQPLTDRAVLIISARKANGQNANATAI